MVPAINNFHRRIRQLIYNQMQGRARRLESEAIVLLAMGYAIDELTIVSRTAANGVDSNEYVLPKSMAGNE